ncbi:HAD-IA family hydrolase [Aliidiomarina sanyensis]|uniref:Phosphoesterase n=1 Tax=Aliidiomarina sanyensis TaxID=1249555 RepID=A0A432WFX7_9GAMM|nr:HAD-IA family hydrolase [Aliidiomarina sanyensis]RUO32663.1 phosphoesterase [Aliidiomarina sanyensis]
MWHFHRRLRPFSLISFDLDDTLYDNGPVILNAEQQLADYIARAWPEVSDMDAAAWRQLRDHVAKEDAALASDMTALRLATLIRGLRQRGVLERRARSLAEEGMEQFLVARNDVTIDPKVIALLDQLAAHYPLVAVSNGNADIHRLGLSDYFIAAYHPGHGRRGKPFTDLFVAAAEGAKLTAPDQLLHIGDHPVSDVQGALNFGAQSIWYVPEPASLSQHPTRLPEARVSELTALHALVPGSQ